MEKKMLYFNFVEMSTYLPILLYELAFVYMEYGVPHKAYLRHY